jgi:formate/nitrite transporter FocA (FNT family)
MSIRQSFLASFLAGICISLGGTVYAMSSDKVIGSIFFCVALLTICHMRLSLYTGKIGFMVDNYKKKDIIDILICLIGNFVGVVLIGSLWPSDTTLVLTCKNIVDAKLAASLYTTFLNAVMCGILMYIAVWIYKNKQSIIGILFCVPTFILAGFEHSIADMFYIAAAKEYTIKSIVFVLLVLLGNTIGSILFSLIFSYCIKNKHD